MKQKKRYWVAKRYCYLLKGISLTSNNDLQFYSTSHKITIPKNFSEVLLWANQKRKMMSSVLLYQPKGSDLSDRNNLNF